MHDTPNRCEDPKKRLKLTRHVICAPNGLSSPKKPLGQNLRKLNRAAAAQHVDGGSRDSGGAAMSQEVRLGEKFRLLYALWSPALMNEKLEEKNLVKESLF